MQAFMGMISMFGFQFAPYQWTFCAGQFVAISQNQALYSLIGTFYGGDGRNTMAMPSLSSRAPAGFNMGGGIGVTPYGIGTKFGFEYITLTNAQNPQHHHLASLTPSGPGVGLSVEVQASTAGGSLPTPVADSHLAGTVDGSGTPYATYTNSPTVTVELGGVTATGGGIDGVVSLNDSGASQDHYNVQPFQAVSFCICEFGTYPSRN